MAIQERRVVRGKRPPSARFLKMSENAEPGRLARLSDVYEILLPNTPPPEHVQAAFRREIAILVEMLMAMDVTTASGSVALRPMKVSGNLKAQDRRGRLAGMNDGQILALVLVALATCGLLAVPGRDQALVGYDLTVIGLALTVAVLIWNKGK
jgi:hypothetical protein